ncbi:hypothetical protein HaLaN_12577, partial [Haematococcus lacustris]
MYEIATGRRAYAKMRQADLLRSKLAHETKDMLEFPPGCCPQSYIDLASSCWAVPSQRPCMDQRALHPVGGAIK